MASSSVPVVNILDDDDDEEVVRTAVAVTPPSSRNRKRSHGASASSSSRDSPDAFLSSSPPLHKRLQLAACDPIAIDDTPPPPRPPPSSVPKPPPVYVVDDDTEPSPAPRDERTPELYGSRSILSDTLVPVTPGFTSPRSSRPPAARRLSSTEPAQKSSGASSFIPLDIDDDDALNRELTDSPPGLLRCDGQPLNADLLHEDSTLPDADVGTGKNPPRVRGARKRQSEEDKLKRQEAKKLKEEEKVKRAEERKQKQQEDKLRKAELADKKKKEKEVNKWESGKYASKCITAVIDTNVVESGSIGGLLLQRLEAKDLKKKITKNPIDRSILWKMEVPNDIAQELSSLNDGCDMNPSSVIELPYIAIVFQAEEFCDLVNKEKIFSHVQDVRRKYPTHTICYITNKLMSYIDKWVQIDYKKKTDWKRPPVEEVFSRLATHYTNVHSRQCINEDEVAEHLVGLTSSLAACKFRKQLTWLSVKANGAIVPDNFIDKNLAKKDTWLKSLIAIPGVQPKNALAIWKEYRCMRSLLNVYMDPSKTESCVSFH